MKYAHIDESGKILGWYSPEIHGENIPTPNIEVSEKQYLYALDNHHNHVESNGLTKYIEPIKTPEQIKAEIEQAIQDMLDNKARELRYDNIMSARSYAGFVNPFQTEAQSLATWCANCWLKAGELETSGVVYTVEEVLAQMPVYVP